METKELFFYALMLTLLTSAWAQAQPNQLCSIGAASYGGCTPHDGQPCNLVGGIWIYSSGWICTGVEAPDGDTVTGPDDPSIIPAPPHINPHSAPRNPLDAALNESAYWKNEAQRALTEADYWRGQHAACGETLLQSSAAHAGTINACASWR